MQRGQGLPEQRHQHRGYLSLGSFAVQPDLRLFSLHPIHPWKWPFKEDAIMPGYCFYSWWKRKQRIRICDGCLEALMLLTGSADSAGDAWISIQDPWVLWGIRSELTPTGCPLIFTCLLVQCLHIHTHTHTLPSPDTHTEKKEIAGQWWLKLLIPETWEAVVDRSLMISRPA